MCPALVGAAGAAAGLPAWAGAWVNWVAANRKPMAKKLPARAMAGLLLGIMRQTPSSLFLNFERMSLRKGIGRGFARTAAKAWLLWGITVAGCFEIRAPRVPQHEGKLWK
jgi:hypothetical protein